MHGVCTVLVPLALRHVFHMHIRCVVTAHLPPPVAPRDASELRRVPTSPLMRLLLLSRGRGWSLLPLLVRGSPPSPPLPHGSMVADGGVGRRRGGAARRQRWRRGARRELDDLQLVASVLVLLGTARRKRRDARLERGARAHSGRLEIDVSRITFEPLPRLVRVGSGARVGARLRLQPLPLRVAASGVPGPRPCLAVQAERVGGAALSPPGPVSPGGGGGGPRRGRRALDEARDAERGGLVA